MKKYIWIFLFSIFLTYSCNNNGDITGDNTGGAWLTGLSQEEQQRNLDPNINTKILFKKGNYGSSYFRIPALIVTKNGTILAASDRRYNKTADLGKDSKIDVILRRSSDFGNTWSEPITVGPGATSPSDSYGDAFFINCHNGDIIIGWITEPGIQAKSPRGSTELYRSSDDGRTWRKIFSFGQDSDIFKAYDADRGFGASGQGLTLRHGKNAGLNRLMFAFFQWNKSGGLSVSAIRSDDDGYNWQNIGNIKPSNPDNNIDETKAIELSDGSIMFNHRRGVTVGQRLWSKSTDGGITWIDQGLDTEFDDPGNNADFVRYEINGKYIKTSKYILTINANVTKNNSWFTARKNHYVRLTKNEFNDGNGTIPGKYAYKKQLVNGGENIFSGYPTIAVLSDGTIGTLTEETSVNEQDAYDIVWRRFNLYWLSDGKEWVDYSSDNAFK